jgi:diacylglycerol kinase (ATP)
MPNWFIILNPKSGNGLAERLWPSVEQCLQDLGFGYSVQFTRHSGHATQLAEAAIIRGARHILGIGGDGTCHEIINGIMMQQEVPGTEVSFALLPIGTGNDWARQYQFPTDPRTRLMQILEPQFFLQDIGLVHFMRDGKPQKRYFNNVAGMAYDGFIGKKLMENPARNKLHYLASVARYLMEYRLRKARITFDDQVIEDAFYTINIGICRYSGGGMQLVPHAVPDDGLLALTIARAMPKWEVLLQTPRFYNGTLLTHPRVEGFQVKSLRVEAIDDMPTDLEADGEYLGETPVQFEVIRNAIKVC